jgi:lipoyl(octanoyl) transferase
MTVFAPLHAIWLGTRPYAPVYELQCELADKRKHDLIDDTVLLLEHEPTITLGRGAKQQHLLSPKAVLDAHDVKVVETDRGGDVTLHAPGQLVAYPILKLDGPAKDVRKYVNNLTRVMQRLAAHYGISSGAAPGMVGLWTDGVSPDSYVDFERAKMPVKVGAIGVRISRWVTMHGFALNMTTDLSLFRHIVPCGISTHGVASIKSLTGHGPALESAAAVVAPLFGDVFEREIARLQVWNGALSVLPSALVERTRSPSTDGVSHSGAALLASADSS